jgi:RNA polymerase sigma factor (sigma-70 family)
MQDYLNEHWGSLFRYACLVVGNLHDAEDVLQNVLSRTYPRWHEVCNRGDPGAYLRKAVINERTSAWRKNRHTTPRADLDSDLAGGKDSIENRTLDSVLVAQLLDTFPVNERAVLVLRYLEGWDYSSIGAVCDISEAAARSLVRRALTRARGILADDESLSSEGDHGRK